MHEHGERGPLRGNRGRDAARSQLRDGEPFSLSSGSRRHRATSSRSPASGRRATRQAAAERARTRLAELDDEVGHRLGPAPSGGRTGRWERRSARLVGEPGRVGDVTGTEDGRAAALIASTAARPAAATCAVIRSDLRSVGPPPPSHEGDEHDGEHHGRGIIAPDRRREGGTYPAAIATPSMRDRGRPPGTRSGGARAGRGAGRAGPWSTCPEPGDTGRGEQRPGAVPSLPREQTAGDERQADGEVRHPKSRLVPGVGSGFGTRPRARAPGHRRRPARALT